MTPTLDLPRYLKTCQTQVDQQLQQVLELPQSRCPKLRDAMRYATLNGGKRFRPVLIYATCEALGAPHDHAHLAACAVELVHSYSLVHDDLPAMDDDDLRRGQPTCHIQFDEATAILAGDALQSLAFEVLALHPAPHLNERDRLRLIQELATASGTLGMAAGQSLDLEAAGEALGLTDLETIHAHKTGKLILASVRMGAICAQPQARELLPSLDRYAEAIGLAFQVQDDILDVTADTATLGKQQGADEALNKATYPALLGLEGAQQKAEELYQQAVAALSDFDANADALRALAHYVVHRTF